MGESSRNVNMEELITYSNNLIQLLKEEKDPVSLQHFFRHANPLQSQCDKDFNEVQKSIQDCEKKICACREKAESESGSDAELDLLQKELEKEQNLEHMLKEELREIINEIDDLERKRDFVGEQKQTIKKFEQDELRAETKLSMYASVTNLIPYLDDPSRISGHIVARDKKVVEKFEFDSSEFTSFDACSDIWKMINLP